MRAYRASWLFVLHKKGLSCIKNGGQKMLSFIEDSTKGEKLVLFQILEDWRDIRAKKTFDDTHFHIKREFIKSNFSGGNRVKQVLVKNIGNCSKKRLENALRYTIKNSDSKAVDQDGKEVGVDEILEDWKKDFSGKENSKEGWHLVFSINEEVNAKNMKTLEKAVKDTMEKNFFEYKYVLVKHTHQNNPHIHVIINKNNIFTKKKLHFKDCDSFRDFFSTIRDDFAMALNYYDPKLKYVNLSKHNRDLELQKIQEKTLNNLDLKVSLDKRVKKLEVESVINTNKIEQNNKAIRDINVEQRILSKKGENAVDEILENQEKLKELEKTNQALRKNNQAITRFMRDFSQLKEVNLSSPFSKQKAIDFLKRNPKMLTLKQIITLPKIEKLVKQEIEDAQKFSLQKIKQDIEHNNLLGGFQKTKKILGDIRECQTNKTLFPEQKIIFEKNVKILKRQLNKKLKNLNEKILQYQKTSDFLDILEKENRRIKNYLKSNKKENGDFTSIPKIELKNQSVDKIFEEIQKEKNKLSVDYKSISKLEYSLFKKSQDNYSRILTLQKSLLKRDYLINERNTIVEYFEKQSRQGNCSREEHSDNQLNRD